MNLTVIDEKSEKNHAVYGTAAQICRGRTAFAVSYISDGKTGVEGEASFYYTPLGMLVYVCVWGLDGEEEVYSLELLGEGGVSCKLPPLYCSGGRAWCSALTGKIVASDILGGVLRISKKCSDSTECIAVGRIKPPRLEEARLKLAL